MSEKRSAFVHFHGLAAGGEAVGHDEGGKVIFAPFAAPGDAAQVQIDEDKKAFGRGTLLGLEGLSPTRTLPPCPQFRPHDPPRSCGGCAWQHVKIEAQREAKRDIVAAALRRLGAQNIEVEPCRGGAAFRYRNKADFVVGKSENESTLGFFARESHDLVPAAVCPIQLPQNEEILVAAREILQQNPRLAFDAATGRGLLRRLVSRVSSQGESLVTLVATRDAEQSLNTLGHALRERVPHLVGVQARIERGAARLIWGRNFLIEEVNGLKFRVSGEAFWQVNPEMTPILANAALELSQVQSGERALDLFCGAGLFALHLARAGAKVTGIESHRGAIEDAKFNAAQQNVSARFMAGDAARELRKFKRGDFDVITLDPPRAGASECLEALLDIAPTRLVYVSCDPATLARDAKVLSAGGYDLKRAIPFDLFPQTAHVETAVLFELR